MGTPYNVLSSLVQYFWWAVVIVVSGANNFRESTVCGEGIKLMFWFMMLICTFFFLLSHLISSFMSEDRKDVTRNSGICMITSSVWLKKKGICPNRNTGVLLRKVSCFKKWWSPRKVQRIVSAP